MKKMYSFKFSLVVLFISCRAVFAQIGMIDSLKIIPTNPTTNDIIKLIAYTTFSSSGCSLTNSNVSHMGTTTSVSLVYTVGMMTTICHSTDTVTLGQYQQGTYDAIVRLAIANTIGLPVYDTIPFSVQKVSGINSITYNAAIKIYPNPANNELFIKSDVAIKNIELYSAIGQNVISVSANEIVNNKISLETLPNGVYMVSFTDTANQRYVKKLVKNN